MRSKLILAVRLIGPITIAGIVVYVVLAIRYWSNAPQLSHNYSAEINAKIAAVPESQRAWPIYRSAVLNLDHDAPEAWRDAVEFEAIADNAEAADWLRSHESDLAAIRRAAQLPALGHRLADASSRDDAKLSYRHYGAELRRERDPLPPSRPSGNPRLMMILLQPIDASNTLVQALHADAVLAADEVDADRMIDDLLSSIRVAQHLREVPFAVCELASARRFSQSLYAWGLLLEHHPELFNSDRLLQLENAVQRYADGRIGPRFELERIQFYDIVQRLYSDDGQGDGFFYATEFDNAVDQGGEPDWYLKLIAPIQAVRFPSRREAVDRYDELLDRIEMECSEPLWKADFSASDAEIDRLHRTHQYGVVTLFTPQLKSVHGSLEVTVQQRDALLAVSAAHRFKLEQGAWPTTLAELTPKYLAELPADRQTGDPLGYVIVDGSPIFYSRGFDRKDDGGRAAIVDVRVDKTSFDTTPAPWHWNVERENLFSPDGDAILWPVKAAAVDDGPEN